MDATQPMAPKKNLHEKISFEAPRKPRSDDEVQKVVKGWYFPSNESPNPQKSNRKFTIGQKSDTTKRIENSAGATGLLRITATTRKEINDLLTELKKHPERKKLMTLFEANFTIAERVLKNQNATLEELNKVKELLKDLSTLPQQET